MDYESRPPLRERINPRLAIMLAVLGLAFVYLLYLPIHAQLSKGLEHHSGYDAVDLKELGNFVFDQNNGTVDDVPKRWRELDGKRVVLEGFMFDVQAAGPRLGKFQFVYNIQKCCFNGPPLVQERVFAHVPKSHEVEWVDGFTRLTGVLHVKVKKSDDGTITSVYTVDVEKAEPIS
ncbi:MAG: hypothetical protein JWP03_936 [Phycisphaerales bacterium]|jgi:hypothetical protein|nr:hypothetical protein [Phycisphaerales bacterium]